MRTRTRHRRGFTVRDLMVTVLVVGALMGLGIRFVSNARETGCRAQCQNNIQDLNICLMQFATIKNHYPNSGTFFDDPAVHGGDPTQSNIYRAITDPGSYAGKPGPWLRSWVIDIFPFLDLHDLANAWNPEEDYLSVVRQYPPYPSNLRVSTTPLPILRCPDDPTAVMGQGNLSYVVNGGFARWPALPVGWDGGKADGQPKDGAVLRWVPEDRPWQENMAVARKLGVMFPGTHTGDQPWDVRTTPADIPDGMSETLLIGENTLAGYSTGTPYSGGVPTNWACPLPNFTTFLGSDDVCRSGRAAGDCLGGQLAPRGGRDGPGWSFASRAGTFEEVGYGQNLTVEGSFPFANGAHPGGSNFGFCDGSVRFISSSIDGTVYARLITPAGTKLPEAIRQTKLGVDEFSW